MFDVSMALGAFLAGLVVGRSDYALRAASEALPLRDAFAVLFFVSVGMLLDPAALLDNPLLRRRHARRRDDRQAAGRVLHHLGDALSVRDEPVGRGRAGADRRVLVHAVAASAATSGC